MPRITRRATLSLATAALGAPTALRAQLPFPDRPVTIVAPFPPGGQADFAARPIAAALQKIWNQPVVVQNRAGAGGGIGHTFVARSAPDGHTLLMGLPSVVFIPESERIRGRTPSYDMPDLAPIARVLADPMLLAVPTASRWRSVQELIADAKARPEAITYASSGIYGTLHIATEMFAQAVEVSFTHVPYTGAGPALAAVLPGTADFLAATPGVIKGAVDGGRLRVIANFGAARNPGFADVPTLMEIGYRSVEYYNWAGLFAPAATPAPIRAELERAMKLAIDDPDTVRAFASGGAEPAWLDTAAFTAFIAADTDRLVAVVRRIGRIE
jgi:tripartite-type tricarboxylate transporter receptor subunit TctC